MIPTIAVVLMLFNHFIADFMLQTDDMALNKSTSWKWLAIHVTVYTLAFTPTAAIIFAVPADVIVFLVTLFLSHFQTDAITSRMTSYFWKKEDRHNFFVTIGFDQFIHAATLILVFQWLTSH
jgi:hypothetical protein